MSLCPYCNTTNPDQYNFCVNCEKQIKCLQCGDSLVANKSRCLGCGKPIEEHNTALGPINKFVLEESQTTETASRKIEGHFTDQAIEQVASIFGGLFNNQVRPIPQVTKPTEVVRPALSSSQSVSLDEIETSVKHLNNGDGVITTAPESHSSELEKAQRYFEFDNENGIVARLSDFKGMTKQDQQKRFMIMYVWAYALIVDKSGPSKKAIMSALANRGFNDSNSSRYFTDIENKYFSKVGEGYKINRDGDREVDRIINEIEDETKTGFQEWGKTKSREKGSRLTRDVLERVELWASKDVDIGNFEIRKLEKPIDYALFAIWILTSHLQFVRAVKPVEIFNYLKKKYIHIPVTQQEISKALSRSYNANLIQRTSDGHYYLSLIGEEKVSSWVYTGVQVDDAFEVDAEAEGDNE